MANAANLAADPVRPEIGRAEALTAARALAPMLRERAEAADAQRGVSRETIEALRQAQLFSLAIPAMFGGAQLGFGALVEVQAELASACGSTGWVYGVLTGHNWMMGLFPREAQAELFSDPHALTASVFRLGGRTTRVDGGYRLQDGDGRFCSGIDHAAWVIVGNPAHASDAPPEPRFHLVPTSEIEIVDDWHTVGMRGTGSRSIRIADAFIPEHRSVAAADLFQGTSPGSALHGPGFYAAPFAAGLPFSLIGAPLGMARAALAMFSEAQRKRFASMAPEHAGEHGALFARAAQAGAEIDAAFALTAANCARLDEDETPLTAVERIRMQRDFAYVAQACRRAAGALFEAGGGSGVYSHSALQRIWRDVNTATSHAAFSWDEAATAFGRAQFGLEPSKSARR